MKALAMVIAAALLLGGCATQDAMNVQVAGNSLCAVPKRDWSVDDTRETIEAAIRFNNGWERQCGKIRKTPVS